MSALYRGAGSRYVSPRRVFLKISGLEYRSGMAMVADGVSVIIHLLNYTVSILLVQDKTTQMASHKPALIPELRELQTKGSSTRSRDGSIQRKNLYMDRRLSILFFHD